MVSLFKLSLSMGISISLIANTYATNYINTIPTTDRLEDIANSCAHEALSDIAPGLAVSIVKGNHLVFERGYGSKTSQAYDPVDARTLFRTGSIQKMMTAAAVLAQQDENRLMLSDSVQNLVPEAHFFSLPRHQQNEIRISNLLDHTSGIPDYISVICDDSITLSSWAASLTGTHTLAPAGTFYNYSNGGYSIAGLVAERAAGIPYADVMKSFVWEPSNMNTTFATVEDAMLYPNRTNGHSYHPHTGEFVSIPMNAYSCASDIPAGTAFTTVGDMARWSMMLMNGGGETLSEESVKKMLTPHAKMYPNNPRSAHYGYGVGIEDLAYNNGGTTRVIAHDGSLIGWNSSTVMFPEAHFSVTVLSNGDEGASEAVQCIMEKTGIYNGLVVQEPEITKPKAWKNYEGIYLLQHTMGEVLPAFVYLDGDKLRLSIMLPNSNEWQDVEAKQVDGNYFYLIDKYSEPIDDITFVLNKGNRAELWLRNRSFVGKRWISYK
ncbi:MAG: serine hydrolase domain-containing protein [Arenicella sp.]